MTKPCRVVLTEPVEVRFAEKVMNTDAVPLVAEGWRYLLEHELCSESGFPNWAASCFWVPGRGFVTVTTDENDGEMWVGMAYVKKEFRREGIMQILWTCVVEYARTKGCQSVGCMVFPDNQEMRAVGERFGKLRSLVYEFKV